MRNQAQYQRSTRKKGNWMVLIYFILAFYFINVPFQFVKIPEFITSFNIWISFAGGIFLVLGGINSLKTRRY
jgi:hypothetical protein